MTYDVDIERLEMSALFDLQGEASAVAEWVGEKLPSMPDRPNTASQTTDISLYWIAAERWLVRADIAQEEKLIELLRPDNAPDELSIVLISDSVKFFQITGPNADDMIAIASSIDHHLSAFPANGVSYTDIFGVKGLLVRIEHGYQFAVESSFVDMIEDYFSRANA